MERIRHKKECLTRLARINDYHCFATNPIYGTDLRNLLEMNKFTNTFKSHFNPLNKFVNNAEQRLENLDEMLNRFLHAIISVLISTLLANTPLT